MEPRVWGPRADARDVSLSVMGPLMDNKTRKKKKNQKKKKELTLNMHT
jgi:hypothetical protein